MKKITMILAVSAASIISARAQGFLNLDFESAYNLPGNPGQDGTLVPVTNALPDWTAYDGSLALANVNYASNYVAGTEASVGLAGGSLALSGEFSAELFGNGSISQTGMVPGDAESLQFEAQGKGTGGSVQPDGFYATLGGQNLSYSPISQGSGYIVYGANIPAGMDGQAEALAFGAGTGNVRLDDIEFSAESVPEPGECAFIGFAAVLFGFTRRKMRTQPIRLATDEQMKHR